MLREDGELAGLLQARQLIRWLERCSAAELPRFGQRGSSDETIWRYQ